MIKNLSNREFINFLFDPSNHDHKESCRCMEELNDELVRKAIYGAFTQK